MTILLLDEATISKIAAGEIIENPASVVKELVENSIDAKSTQIIVELKGTTTDYIRVSDNGCGIAAEDIDLAFLRHSTSKLKSIDDLQDIHSLGFRGEALASISHVSKLKMMTKSKDNLAGTMVEVENGVITKKKNIGMPQGTTFYVSHLFYNTPVRKKFLKSDTIESNYIFDMLQKLALGNPNVSMKFLKDGKTLLQTSSTDNYKNHIFSVLGKEIAGNLIETNFKSESYQIKLFISNNKLFRSTRTHQYIYINGRYVSNILISRAIEKLYHSLIPLNRYPIFIAYIEIDPILVDVNIHPKKQEVKLSKENNLLAILSEMVEEVLYPNRSIPEVVPLADSSREKTVFEIYNKDECFLSSFSEDNTNEKRTVSEPVSSYGIAEPLKEENIFSSMEKKEDKNAPTFFDSSAYSETHPTSWPSKVKNSLIDEKLLNTRILGTIFKTYIILEDGKEEKIFLIDQHAAHERVLYEKFKTQYLTQSIHSQILLTPELIELSPMEYNKIQEHREQFSLLGFELESFGESTMLLRSVPVIFGLPAYRNMIRDIIESLDLNISSNYEADLYLIMKKACKRAVKSGDHLSDKEIFALIKDLIHCENPYTCPHGRPTIIDLKKLTIEKLFLRD